MKPRAPVFAQRKASVLRELAIATLRDPLSAAEDIAAAEATLAPRTLDRHAVAGMSIERKSLLRALLRESLGEPPLGGADVHELAAIVGRGDGVNAHGWRSPDGRRDAAPPPGGEPAAPAAPAPPAPVDADDELGSWPARAPEPEPVAQPAPPAPVQRPAGALASIGARLNR